MILTRKGVNYEDTSAKMARLETWRILFIIALAKGWKVRQWDIVAAYLQAELKHTVYITDLNENGEIEDWVLHKALYGQRSQDRDSSGRFVARRTGERNRCNSKNGRLNDIVVYPTTGYYLTLDFGSGIIAAAEGAKDASWLRQPRDEDTANKPSDSTIHGQYGNATALAGWELPQTNEAPRQSTPLHSRSNICDWEYQGKRI
jgi:hypothetical protein